MYLFFLTFCLFSIALGGPIIEPQLSPRDVSGSSTFSPVRPPAIPLAVKSPYLSAWVRAGSQGGNGGYLAGQWPSHWSGKTLGWAGMIKVDGRTYIWMGDPQVSGASLATQTSMRYTSTSSVFTMTAGGVQITINFLSPITPNDLKRESLLGSYMDIQVKSIDGNTHAVSVYTDISGEWASGDTDQPLTWSTRSYKGVQVHQIKRQLEIEFDESDKPDGNGMANWGTIWYATENDPALSFMINSDANTRSRFVDGQSLNNNVDQSFRAASNDWPVFAFAKQFTNLGLTPQGMRVSIGLLQQNAIQFLNGQGVSKVPSLWTTYWANPLDAATAFHSDWSTMSSLSSSLDQKVVTDSVAAGGSDLAMITSLSARQVFGAMQLVGSQGDPMMFMKEISSNGNTQTVDVVFPMHPILLYFNPTLLKYVLQPLFSQQETGHWPHTYALHDVGSHYPNATGHADGNAEDMPVEECGDMIIMTAAYTQRTKDYAFAKQHYPILKQWTQYLIDDSLIPANQLSTDDFAGLLANQTNLALKGIIGIRAMAILAQQTGNTADANRYTKISQDYIKAWQTFAIATGANPPHTTLNYGNAQSHGLLYNLWCDVELGTNLVPKSVYDMQSAFYLTQRNAYGVPLDTRHGWTKTDWLIFSAAASSKSTSQVMISDIVKFLRDTSTSLPFTDLYETSTAGFPGVEFKARPVMGGAFAPLVAQHA